MPQNPHKDVLVGSLSCGPIFNLRLFGTFELIFFRSFWIPFRFQQL